MLCMIKEVQNSKDSSTAFGPFGLPLEYWTYKRLFREVLVDFDATLELCQANGLLSRHRTCSICGDDMELETRDGIDGLR